MKLRNVRRRQWDRYTDRLTRISESAPQPGDPFLQAMRTVYPGYHRTYLRIVHRQAVAWRRRRARYGSGDIW